MTRQRTSLRRSYDDTSTYEKYDLIDSGPIKKPLSKLRCSYYVFFIYKRRLGCKYPHSVHAYPPWYLKLLAITTYLLLHHRLKPVSHTHISASPP